MSSLEVRGMGAAALWVRAAGNRVVSGFTNDSLHARSFRVLGLVARPGLPRSEKALFIALVSTKYLMMRIGIIWFALCSIASFADVAKFPDSDFWKSSYVEMSRATVVGAWKSDDTAYVFRGDGTGAILNGEFVTATFTWKQRQDGKVYADRNPIVGAKGEVRRRYVGYVERRTFVRDALDHKDGFRKVRSKRLRARLGAGPVVKLPKSERVEVRNAKMELVRTIDDPADLVILTDCIRDALKIGSTETVQHVYTHKVGLEQSWRYDTSSGDLTLLSKVVTPVYRIRRGDRQRFERLLKPCN